MKKIYYLKQEVKIGDIIDIDRFKVQITQRVIDENPDKFVLKGAEIIPNKKTFEDYENQLLNQSGYFLSGRIYTEQKEFYHLLKTWHRKLYYLHVLQLIANDLNDGWRPDWKNYSSNFEIVKQANSQYSVILLQYANDGSVYFKSEEITKKAIELMGDNLKYIYGNV